MRRNLTFDRKSIDLYFPKKFVHKDSFGSDLYKSLDTMPLMRLLLHLGWFVVCILIPKDAEVFLLNIKFYIQTLLTAILGREAKY